MSEQDIEKLAEILNYPVMFVDRRGMNSLGEMRLDDRHKLAKSIFDAGYRLPQPSDGFREQVLTYLEEYLKHHNDRIERKITSLELRIHIEEFVESILSLQSAEEQYEEAHLEVLSDEEIKELSNLPCSVAADCTFTPWGQCDKCELAIKKAVSRRTLDHNLSKGKLYRRVEK